MSDLVIAIDGPAASGKSTVAQLVAKKLNAYYINTGNMYRAAAFAAVKKNLDLNNINEERILKFTQENTVSYFLSPEKNMVLTLNDEPLEEALIRTPEVSQNSSKIAASKAIRKWLVNEQRTFVKFGLIVMEGRDIGTNVFPNAKYKFFLTASPEIRAVRRLTQDGNKPSQDNINHVAKEIAERDRRDSERKTAPLKKGADAVLVDSSNMDINEVVDFIASKVVNS